MIAKNENESMNDTLEVRDLHVSVEGKQILHGVTAAFYRGKTYALMGPNGCGKSTLGM